MLASAPPKVEDITICTACKNKRSSAGETPVIYARETPDTHPHPPHEREIRPSPMSARDREREYGRDRYMELQASASTNALLRNVSPPPTSRQHKGRFSQAPPLAGDTSIDPDVREGVKDRSRKYYDDDTAHYQGQTRAWARSSGAPRRRYREHETEQDNPDRERTSGRGRRERSPEDAATFSSKARSQRSKHGQDPLVPRSASMDWSRSARSRSRSPSSPPASHATQLSLPSSVSDAPHSAPVPASGPSLGHDYGPPANLPGGRRPPLPPQNDSYLSVSRSNEGVPPLPLPPWPIPPFGNDGHLPPLGPRHARPPFPPQFPPASAKFAELPGSGGQPDVAGVGMLPMPPASVPFMPRARRPEYKPVDREKERREKDEKERDEKAREMEGDEEKDGGRQRDDARGFRGERSEKDWLPRYRGSLADDQMDVDAPSPVSASSAYPPRGARYAWERDRDRGRGEERYGRRENDGQSDRARQRDERVHEEVVPKAPRAMATSGLVPDAGSRSVMSGRGGHTSNTVFDDRSGGLQQPRRAPYASYAPPAPPHAPPLSVQVPGPKTQPPNDISPIETQANHSAVSETSGVSASARKPSRFSANAAASAEAIPPQGPSEGPSRFGQTLVEKNESLVESPIQASPTDVRRSAPTKLANAESKRSSRFGPPVQPQLEPDGAQAHKLESEREPQRQIEHEPERRTAANDRVWIPRQASHDSPVTVPEMQPQARPSAGEKIAARQEDRQHTVTPPPESRESSTASIWSGTIPMALPPGLPAKPNVPPPPTPSPPEHSPAVSSQPLVNNDREQQSLPDLRAGSGMYADRPQQGRRSSNAHGGLAREGRTYPSNAEGYVPKYRRNTGEPDAPTASTSAASAGVHPDRLRLMENAGAPPPARSSRGDYGNGYRQRQSRPFTTDRGVSPTFARPPEKLALQDRIEDGGTYNNAHPHDRRGDRPSMVRGGSLLDRLSDPVPSSSAVPSKRGRSEMFVNDGADTDAAMDDSADFGTGNGSSDGNKRARWKGANSGERVGGGGMRGAHRASFTRRIQ